MKNEETKVIEAFKNKGFNIMDTGGNCTAFYKEIGEVIVIITEEDGLSIPRAFNESIMVGAYVKTDWEESNADWDSYAVMDSSTRYLEGLI